MTTDSDSERILKVVRSWVTTRHNMVKVRSRSQEAGLFAANQGVHLAFLRGLMNHASELAGIPCLKAMSFRGWEALGTALATDSLNRWEAVSGISLPVMDPVTQEAFQELTYSWLSELSTLRPGMRRN